ncbi:MAG TPA: TonB-dependent receptor [Povalibacter sp.]|nr:TonB-dependent receptor [Povalibacter sp.]
MNYQHPTPRGSRRAAALLGATVAAILLTAAAPGALGQATSATLKGQIVNANAPATSATIKVTNVKTGYSRTVEVQGANYSVGGLPPGTYQVLVTAGGQQASRTVVVQVGQIATLDLDVAPAEPTESVIVTASQLYETKTSEVSQYVSLRQIEALPQNSRNFLAFADIVPGVQFVTSADGSTSEVRSGAQAANGVNVFIDGVGQKNYVLRGGVSGQTLTRGNPFPQLGVGEYKVITSNYKAEFDQLSSAAIIAVTKSGTNEFKSAGFWDKTSEKWREPDPIEKEAGVKSPSSQEQYGISFSGPIIRDRMHFFVTYEAKDFETPKTITYGEGSVTNDQFDDLLGPTSAPFKEDLVFGKIDWTPADDHLLELSVKYRTESEITNIGDQNTHSFASTKDNDETRVDLRWLYTGLRFMNDAHVTYEDAAFNPRPLTIAPGYRLTTADVNQVLLNMGGGPDYQDKGQKGYAFQDDVTFDAFEWHGAHVIKTGIKYKFITINAFEQQPYNPQFSYDINQDLSIPYQVQFGEPLPGLPERNVTSDNRQFGIYVQDDWDATDKLQLNLGIRWDYEETPSYLHYVTPADVVAGINAIDPAADPALNQTYRQTLALGGINIDDYISNGRNRSSFTDAIQPRVGFSYDFTDTERWVLFGGAGRAFDRNVFDYLAIERSKGTFPTYQRRFNTAGHECDVGVGDCIAWDPSYLQPGVLAALVEADPNLGREINLINNDLKTPYSDQFSLGLRNRMDFGAQTWTGSLTFARIESKDGIVFLLGNRYPDGSFRANPDATWGGQPWGNGIPGLGTLIIAKNGLETRSNQVLLNIEKSYTESSPWSFTFAYTYTDAKENRGNVAATDEHYIFDYPDVAGYGWHQSIGVPKHRVVSTVIYDTLWDLTISAKLTLSSPLAYEAVDCHNTTDFDHCFFNPVQDSATVGYKQFDLSLEKRWTVWHNADLRLRGDVLNVFNNENINSVDTWRGGPPPDTNVNFGTATSFYQPTRTFKLSLGYNW